MEKFIFKKLYNNITLFFIVSLISVSLIIWIIQAINYLDIVSEDGHGLKIYFMYTLYSLPKIISRILLFIFFTSVFFIILRYEERNELLLFWINGINKIDFSKKIIKFSLIYLVIQLILSSYIVPYTQFKAKSFLRGSKIEYLPSIVAEQKFNDAVKNLTIFIDKKENNLLHNVLIKEELSQDSFQIITAKKGQFYLKDGSNALILSEGKIINNEKGSINSFSFKNTEINLSNYMTKRTLYPKIQEASLIDLFYCFKDSTIIKKMNLNLKKPKYLLCNNDFIDEIFKEIVKRLYLPIYIPILAMIATILILSSRDYINHNYFKTLMYLNGFGTIVISEISIRYAGKSTGSTILFFSLPLIIFLINYWYLNNKLKVKD